MRIKDYFSYNKSKILFVIIFIILESISPSLVLFIQQNIVDEITKGMFDLKYPLILLITILAITITKLLNSNLTQTLLENIRKSILKDTAKGYLKINPLSFEKPKTDIHILVNQNIESIMKSYFGSCFSFLSTVFIALASYFYAFYINKIIAFVSIIFMAINLMINIYGGKKLSSINSENAAANSSFMKFINNYIKNFHTIKSMKMEKVVKNKFETKNEEYSGNYLKLKNRLSNFNTFNAVFYAFQKLTVIILGAYFFSKNIISPGELISTIFLSSFLSSPLIKLSGDILNIKSTEGFRNEIEGVINYKLQNENSEISAENEKEFKFFTDSISYAEKEVIEKTEITFEYGKKYLILGKNGEGKSTLMKKLVLSLFFSKLKERIGFVQQNESLLKGSMYENISFFGNNDEKEINKLLKLFDININTDYSVDPEKRNLSKGQIQRILLIRQLINEKNILLFDETFTGLDSKNEEKVLDYLLKDRNLTIIMSSHKIKKEELVKFDVILFIKNKKILKGEMSLAKENLYEEYME